jgi:hypothetical protein
MILFAISSRSFSISMQHCLLSQAVRADDSALHRMQWLPKTNLETAGGTEAGSCRTNRPSKQSPATGASRPQALPHDPVSIWSTESTRLRFRIADPENQNKMLFDQIHILSNCSRQNHARL